MKKLFAPFIVVTLGLILLLTPALMDKGTVRLIAQAAFFKVMASGKTNGWAAPAYLRSCLYSATTTGNTCHTGPTVLGCVVINTAGAASSTIKLYDQAGLVVNSLYLQETIDATQVGRQFCYGRLFRGGLQVAIASGGAAPDVTITYQGQ